MSFDRLRTNGKWRIPFVMQMIPFVVRLIPFVVSLSNHERNRFVQRFLDRLTRFFTVAPKASAAGQ